MAKTKSKPKTKAKSTELAAELVTIDRRGSKDRRDQPTTESKSSKPVTAKKTAAKVAAEAAAPRPMESMERRIKVNRRRQIDPTTCEREYSLEEVEFMQALDLYKRQNGRMFPTCSEVLEVIRSLGYIKLAVGMTVVPLAQAEQGALASNEPTTATFEQVLYGAHATVDTGELN